MWLQLIRYGLVLSMMAISSWCSNNNDKIIDFDTAKALPHKMLMPLLEKISNNADSIIELGTFLYQKPLGRFVCLHDLPVILINKKDHFIMGEWSIDVLSPTSCCGDEKQQKINWYQIKKIDNIDALKDFLSKAMKVINFMNCSVTHKDEKLNFYVGQSYPCTRKKTNGEPENVCAFDMRIDFSLIRKQ